MLKKSVFRFKKKFFLFTVVFLMTINLFGAMTGTYFVPPNKYYIANDNYGKSLLQDPPNGSILILRKECDFSSISCTWNGKSSITLKAEVEGTNVINGTSKITITNSSYIIIQDIIFKDIIYSNPSSYVIGFYNSENCFINECAFISCGGSITQSNGTIYIGTSNEEIDIEWCTFFDTRSKAIEVYLHDNPSYQNQNITISGNYFKDITKFTDNGNEALLLGRGYVVSSDPPMNAIVKDNLFENCVGDNEIISNKANGNIIEGNTFLNNYNSSLSFLPGLSLRCGNGTIVRNNVFLNTAIGIVVHGDNHKIYNNYIEDSQRGIWIRGPIGSSHANSSNCYIANNTIVNSANYGMLFGYVDGTARIPGKNYIYNNFLHYNPLTCDPNQYYFYQLEANACSNQIWLNNYVTTPSSVCNGGGFYNPTGGITYVRDSFANVSKSTSDGLFRLNSNSNLRGEGTNISFVSKDMDNQSRYSGNDIGSDQYSSYTPNIVLSSNDVGVTYNYTLAKKVPNIFESNDIITDYKLFANYPNPFNPSTIISYQIPENEFVSLSIYNSLGQLVTKLVNEFQTAGKYSVQFNSKDLSSGTYFYQIKCGSYSKISKMLLLK